MIVRCALQASTLGPGNQLATSVPLVSIQTQELETAACVPLEHFQTRGVACAHPVPQECTLVRRRQCVYNARQENTRQRKDRTTVQNAWLEAFQGHRHLLVAHARQADTLLLEPLPAFLVH